MGVTLAGHAPPEPSSTAVQWCVAAALVLGGCALRYVQFSLGRGFWLDEAWLAMALDDFDLRTPTRPLSEHQAAPLGFLVLSKVAVDLFGAAEWVYRLLPYVCGCLLLLLWYPLLQRPLGGRVALVSLALVALSAPLVHYASEFKPYGVDAFVTLVMTGLVLRYLPVEARRLRHSLALAVAGILAMLLSFPAVFVLAAGGLAIVWQDGRRQRPATYVIGGVWVLFFALYYLEFMAPVARDPYLVQFWSEAYAPGLPWAPETWAWYGDTLHGVFTYFFGDLPSGVALALYVIGTGVLWRASPRRAMVVIAPVVLILVASLVGSYPIRDRLVMFALPLLCIVIAVAIDGLLDTARSSRRAVGLVMAAVLCVPALDDALTFSRFPLPRHDPRPLLQNLADNALAGDTVYVAWPLVPVVRHYVQRYPLTGLDIQYGESRPEFHLGSSPAERWPVYDRELAALQGQGRVWVLLDRFINDAPRDEAYFLGALNHLGRQVSQRQGPICDLFLYELGPPATP